MVSSFVSFKLSFYFEAYEFDLNFLTSRNATIEIIIITATETTIIIIVI